MNRVNTHHRAFTLTEILVIVGVMAVLVGILIPSVIFALRATERMKHESRINQIQIAMTDFKDKTRDYPKYITGKSGAEALMKRLTRDQYIGMKKYNALLPPNHEFVRTLDDGTTFFEDPRGNPILYYRSNSDWVDSSSGTDVNKDAEGLWDDTKGVYRPKDNDALLEKLGIDVASRPDLTRYVGPQSPEYGRLFSSRVLIVAAGIDGLFGTEDDLYKWELE